MGVAAEPFEPFAVGHVDTSALLAALSNRPLDLEKPTYEDGYLFANELHWDAMKALGLSARLLSTGYIYLTRADDPHTDYATLIAFGTAERPDPAAPKPVSRFSREQMEMVRDQSRMQVMLHGGPRDGEEEWVPMLAMLNGIDSGDGGSYRYIAEPDSRDRARSGMSPVSLRPICPGRRTSVWDFEARSSGRPARSAQCRS